MMNIWIAHADHVVRHRWSPAAAAVAAAAVAVETLNQR